MSKHIAIIGGGIVGLSTAWFCRQQGHQVTLIDRGQARRDGCSFGNAGMLVPSHIIPLAAPGMISLGLKWMWNPESPFYIRPVRRWTWCDGCGNSNDHVRSSMFSDRRRCCVTCISSRELYEQLEIQLPGGFGLKTRGLLMLCKTAAGLDEEANTAAKANSLGVPAQVLDAAATAELDPSVEMDVHGSVFYPKDCHLYPNRLMASLESALEADGCQFMWETRSLGFSKSGGRVDAVVTNRGEVTADEFVLCGGVWSTELGKQLGLSLPMQAGKGYSVTLEEPGQLPELCSLLHEARVAVTPMGGSLRVGGTMEIAGIDESVSQSRVRGILQAVPNYFPAFKAKDFAGRPVWSGLRPCSPDGLPYLGRTSRWSNVLISTGHAMMGISLALVSGEIAASLISGQPTELTGLSLLSPDRYLK